MKFWNTLPALALLPLVLLAAPAHAQLLLSLAPAAQAGAPGDTLYFTGTLDNPTAGSVFLNSESVSLDGFAPDSSPFLSTAPLSLDPMGTTDGSGNPTDSYTGSFFDITLGTGVAPGTYAGTVSILGGADANTFDTVATEDFSVTILPAAVPEASSVVSMGVLLGLGGIGLWAAKRRRPAAAR